MSLTAAYNLRHIVERKVTALMTLGGIALVVFVFVATQMLSRGLEQTLGQTGSPQNAIAIRLGAENEIQSGISREQTNILLAEPEISRLPDNRPFATSDTVVVVSLKRKAGGGMSNITVRGVGELALKVRSDIRLVAGRLPALGTRELMVGAAIQRKFSGLAPGDNLRLASADWPIVGTFDAGNSAFSSEVWGDVETLMPAFRRGGFSSVTFRLAEGADLEALSARLAKDPRLSVQLRREDRFYADQSKILAAFIRTLGTVVSVIFSIGAILGAMITMYSSVAHRTREIGMLRAIGFERRSIFVAFGIECILMGAAGALCGILLAGGLSFITVSTTNFETFAEIAFNFKLTGTIVLWGLLFGTLMGAIGGALPAFRAARVNVLEALRDE